MGDIILDTFAWVEVSGVRYLFECQRETHQCLAGPQHSDAAAKLERFIIIGVLAMVDRDRLRGIGTALRGISVGDCNSARNTLQRTSLTSC